MKIKVEKKKIYNIIMFIVWCLLYVLITEQYISKYIFQESGLYWSFAIKYVLLFFLFAVVFNNNLRVNISSTVWPYIIFMPFFMVAIFEKIWQGGIQNLSRPGFVHEYLLCLAITVSLIVITGKQLLVYYIEIISTFIIGIIYYFIFIFRGEPVSPRDIMAYKTAITVMDQYKYSLTDNIITAFLWCIGISIILYVFTPGSIHGISTITKVILPSIVILFNHNLDWKNITNVTIGSWDRVYYIEQNGALVSFIQECQESVLKKPIGYSAELAEQVLDKYNQPKDVDTIHPNIVVIMNESFSDLKELGEFESDDYLANWNSFEDYIMKGSTYVSVRGGGTCNSEYEFLTGNSMYFDSGYPYIVYDLGQCFNAADVMKKKGYDTYAIHPNISDAWNREKVYSDFGFDSFITINDIEEPTTIRWFVDDKTCYREVEDILNEDSDKPKFIFTVTIQNHGGYGVLDEKIKPIKIENEIAEFSDAMTYLSYIKTSDEYFADFIDSIKDDEPTLVCFFGDHQPSINDGFEEYLAGGKIDNITTTEKFYKTPYMIWANYDIGKEKVNKDMSLNYLFANLMQIAGYEDTYTNYLLDLQNKVPIITALGYMDSAGSWNEKSDKNPFDITEYWSVKYYMQTEGKSYGK